MPAFERSERPTGFEEPEAPASVAGAAAAASGSVDFAELSHRLRTPLNVVMGFAQLLECEAHGPLGHPRYAEYAAAIRTGSGDLLKVLADVLALAEIAARPTEDRLAPWRKRLGSDCRPRSAAARELSVAGGTGWPVRGSLAR